MTNRQVKIWVGIMFFFLISLVFFIDKGHALPNIGAGERELQKEARVYMRYYNMGQAVAKEDYKHGQLWKRYEHKMTETLKEQAFREGYLDAGAYYAMSVVKKIKWDMNGKQPSNKWGN